jgi:hypothetical protein
VLFVRDHAERTNTTLCGELESFIMFQHVHTYNLVQCTTSRKIAGSIPMVSLEFLIGIILPAALWPWGRLRLELNLVRGVLFRDKRDLCVGLATLPPLCSDCLKSGSLNLLEPSGPVQACVGSDQDLYV